MKPSIGRIVHYTVGEGDEGDRHFAAVITHVWSDICVNLYVFPKSALHHEEFSGVQTSVLIGGETSGSHWHFPERVE